jgi:uncharacterized alkaline shock family protein YloU
MTADIGVGGSGYTIDDLSDYLDRGRSPAIAAIDTNAECQAMLASLARVAGLSLALLEDDAAKGPPLDEAWMSSLLATIGRELRAGRDIPISGGDDATRLSVSEGAIRELVRAAGDSVDGVLVGKCELLGDVEDAAAEIIVHVTISVVLSAPVVQLAQQVRERIHTELLRHTQLRVASIDITVTDVHDLVTQAEGDLS